MSTEVYYHLFKRVSLALGCQQLQKRNRLHKEAPEDSAAAAAAAAAPAATAAPDAADHNAHPAAADAAGHGPAAGPAHDPAGLPGLPLRPLVLAPRAVHGSWAAGQSVFCGCL